MLNLLHIFTAAGPQLAVLALGLMMLCPDAQAAYDMPELPLQFDASLNHARRACLDEGGTRLTIAKDAMQVIGPIKKGRYIVALDFHKVKCHGIENAFCGTEGCELVVLLKTNNRYALIFQRRAISYKFLAKIQSMTFRVHGTYCGKAGTDLCLQTIKLAASK
ncbi:hypothetical protein [Variovorax paradoxus]|uniref:hypothetical protein n=1 Tax=Variovorax paradoxus TaxID=34073 RepID=UPI003D64F5E0